ncbi:probable cyclin-dependent serine/threonine-protein kinase DDB_G0292550 isoform X2 [Solenopsis invicta]|uniref:probable cyclin-dependent serine/threonine-protein kinase DDB_G0292550 isoform X2 n=1 Tax=Solenopsis invicta TaxID=13686 RepID=UPI0005960ED8|nr:probable cyclin-dependent serine/threonine-protein kinase DDB_G0292550 isoform X2 [Solenopsis invicta]XP_011158403.1 probable cyclin-dependent serine/threonine-protein kinase DDB_G0292550 isoform X2 [Solenopsis invicta]XP_011158404.1 probable cyclin-dependent serine/threonine-protein kinase DDB_G0292550 isoform X2 [Solenopsis invicta]
MDYPVESLEKTPDIEWKATLDKLLNMQWLKNTSYSANPEKIKAVVYKQAHNQDVDQNKEIEAQAAELTETIKIRLAKERDKYTCETHLSNDTMPEKDENIWNKDMITDLFPNADKLDEQKNEEDMLSIVESIVTAKLEAEFCVSEENEDQSSTSENKDITQDAVCTNVSDLQKTGDGELKLIKHSDGNNNDSSSVIPCMPNANEKQNSTCNTTGRENNQVSTEEKDKDKYMKTNNITKTNIKIENTNLTKDTEKSSILNSDSKNSKSSSITDKNAKDYLSNKHNAKNNTRKEFVKQRNSRSGIKKETKNISAKPNLVKAGNEATDTCQSKNLTKDKTSQKHTSKQFASKLKGQDSLGKNASTPNSSDDKNRTTPEKLDSPLNESEKKNEKLVNERNLHSDQKATRVDFRKNSTFVSQYKHSTFSKWTHNIPKTGQASTHGRNSSYMYNNPKFGKYRNGGFERVTKKEHTPANTLTKSSIGTEELDTNLESCTNQKREIIPPADVKSTCEVDTVVFNNTNNVNSVKVETHLIQSKENMNLNADYGEQEPTISEQLCDETNNISRIDQQYEATNNEEMNPFKHSSNLAFDNCVTDSQVNMMHRNQYSLKPENVQHTNEINQLESGQATWNQSSDNAVQKDVTVMSVQQSIQNMHFNSQQIFTQAGNSLRQMSPWESNTSKFYDQHFSVGDAMRMSQIPNTFNASPYEYNVQMSNDNIVTSTLETTMSNRENSSLLYRYEPNVQHKPVMSTDFPGHSMSCQTNQVRWDSSIQDGFHVEHPYVVTQPTLMHVYNPAAFGPDDFDNTHTIDYVSHPVIYAPSPYMQTWNSQLSLPIMYNSPCTNYTAAFPHNNQSNNLNCMHDHTQQHKPYAQTSNCIRDNYDMNTYAVQERNTVSNIPIRSNYHKKHQDNCRAVYNVPEYAAPVSYSRSQQGMNSMQHATINQYNAPYYQPNQKHYKQNGANYVRNPKSQVQDFVCDDNNSKDIPPIISPKEFVTSDINLSNKTDQYTTRVFKPEFKTKSNSTGYRPPPSLPRYNNGFRRNITYQDFPKEYTYPVSIGRGTYKMKKT